ncbi:WhiB family transcriptional regulator [Actinacidiphila sp. DG2A-62]|uniref:WhiB family transcriptional regulator n=1 Tax=Actinacidiphila sp. DG2A-62 TaxID=3108821 RepID=UPI002DBEE310|nr:WhiB family transcriptional regulator [Actinacidiphila sp. DG2A-62]MEC3995239.1 WhiB family transcriptional regulator [Actinacidiphila sp. DG2A-62]
MPRIPRPADHVTLPRPHHWSDDAACRGIDTAEFFPAGKGGVPASVEAAYAKSFCERCPVQPDCLGHALTYREDYGVWGGLDEDERAELLRQARRAAERQRRQEREKAKADASSAA